MFRSRSKQESLIGLFILLGIVLFGGIIFFLRGSSFKDKDYELKFIFNDAGGLREGAKVYYRGVAVGRITSIDPSSNGVEVSGEIDSDLLIPKDVTVTTLRTGLLGDVSINVIPKSNLDSIQKKIDPREEECNEQDLVLCDEEEINAKSTPDLFESLAVITDRLNNDEFFEKVNRTLVNVNETSLKIALLSDELTGTIVDVRKELNTFIATTEKIGTTADEISNTARVVNGTVEKFGNTADVATTQIESLSDSYRNTAIELNLLANNLNRLIDDNKTNFRGAIDNFTLTTNQINKLIGKTDLLLAEVSTEDVAKISQNLGKTSDNLTQITQDLRVLSEELNNPTNLITLQQTLDSARVTFANTAKITSDIDEFTGDPEFRNNLRKLVDGLGNLVSYTDVLEKQIELAKLLEEVEKIAPKENLTIQNKSGKFPTAFSGDETNSKFKNQN